MSVMTAARPKRQRKADPLLNPALTQDEIQCDYAIAPFDRQAREMDRKWGIDRLPELVSVATAEKYGLAVAHLNACIAECDPAKVAAAAQNCIKGMSVMDAEATAVGHQPATGDVWEADVDGYRFGILKDGAEWQAAQERRPSLLLFTMREIGVLLRAAKTDHPLLAEAKKFGGAQITKFTPKLTTEFFEKGGDEIPW